MNVNRHKESVLLLLKIADKKIVVKASQTDIKGFLDMLSNAEIYCPSCGESLMNGICEECEMELRK